MQGRGMLKKPPRVRDNNGALQVMLRLDGRDHFINRLGRFDDPVAQARGQAICAEIWRDAQQGDLDLSLNRYRPLVEGRDQDLLDSLRSIPPTTAIDAALRKMKPTWAVLCVCELWHPPLPGASNGVKSKRIGLGFARLRRVSQPILKSS